MDIRRFLQENAHLISRYSMVLAIIVLICFFIPKQAKFKYEFELDKPWKYEELLAPFDYAIEKSEIELEIERKAIRESFAPYYELNTDVILEKEKFVLKAFLIHTT